METVKVTISNPNPYPSKDNKIPMVAYKVTGSKEAVAQFIADQEARRNGECSKDDEGNPLQHYTQKAGVRYGATNVLQRAVNANGDVIWFSPTVGDDKQEAELIAGMDETTKLLYAQQQLAAVKAYAKLLTANRSKNIAALQAKNSAEKL